MVTNPAVTGVPQASVGHDGAGSHVGAFDGALVRGVPGVCRAVLSPIAVTDAVLFKHVMDIPSRFVSDRIKRAVEKIFLGHVVGIHDVGKEEGGLCKRAIGCLVVPDTVGGVVVLTLAGVGEVLFVVQSVDTERGPQLLEIGRAGQKLGLTAGLCQGWQEN